MSRLVIAANNQTAKQQLINIRRQNGRLTPTRLLLAVHVAGWVTALTDPTHTNIWTHVTIRTCITMGVITVWAPLKCAAK